MKYALTLNFDSKEDLLEFLNENKSETVESTTVAATTAKKSRAKKVDAPENVMADVVLPEAPQAPASIFPFEKVQQIPVQQAPVVQQQQAAPFDRNMVIAHISATNLELKNMGVADAKIAEIFGSIFKVMALAPGKISNLDDTALYTFYTHYSPAVAALKAPAQTNNFI